jgi:hypothetical protein
VAKPQDGAPTAWDHQVHLIKKFTLTRAPAELLETEGARAHRFSWLNCPKSCHHEAGFGRPTLPKMAMATLRALHAIQIRHEIPE